jgi:hypothetical protein
MIATPGEIPLTNPDDNPIVAMPVAEEVQVPPEIASLRTVVAPVHRLVGPVMAEGVLLTVIVVVVTQPVGKV